MSDLEEALAKLKEAGLILTFLDEFLQLVEKCADTPPKLMEDGVGLVQR